jgi:hypothetical protein
MGIPTTVASHAATSKEVSARLASSAFRHVTSVLRCLVGCEALNHRDLFVGHMYVPALVRAAALPSKEVCAVGNEPSALEHKLEKLRLGRLASRNMNKLALGVGAVTALEVLADKGLERHRRAVAGHHKAACLRKKAEGEGFPRRKRA